jgi:secreted Zn-dependent insulinase-like peptidase
VKHKEIPISKFRNKFEYKMSKLSDEKLEQFQKKLIKQICKLEADTLDFYDYKKTIEKYQKEDDFENN